MDERRSQRNRPQPIDAVDSTVERKQYSPPVLVRYGSLRELTHFGQNEPPTDAFFAGSFPVT